MFEGYRNGNPRQGIFDETITSILLQLGEKGSAGGEGWLRPDIVNRRTRVLYEVKSVRGASMAMQEVKDYIDVFRRAGACITAGRKGPGTDGSKTWPSGLRVDWSYSGPGLILYEFTELPGDLVPIVAPARSRQKQNDSSNNRAAPGLETVPLWLILAAGVGSLFSTN